MRALFLSFIALSCVYATQEVQTSHLSNQIDLSNYKEIKKEDTRIIVDSNLSSVDGVYNYVYSPNSQTSVKEENLLLNGNFDKIHRYESLYFDESNETTSYFSQPSIEVFQEIVKQIHKYVDDESREIVVSVLGFTQKIENTNEDITLDTGYTNFFQSIAQRDNLNPDDASGKSLNFIDTVYKKMIDNNISEEILYKENRFGRDNLYTEEFSEGRSLNNRVDIAIYVKELIDPDTDGDGVHDSKDYCPDTPIGSNVDTNGCPLILTLDLKFDFDKATISDEKSLNDVKKLSVFMSKYPAYHANIVGHTDSIGKEKYNQNLSLRRAEVVLQMIIKDGVKASRLSYEGRGEREPLFENINPFNRHKNRRTEVELTLPETEKKESKLSPRTRGIKG